MASGMIYTNLLIRSKDILTILKCLWGCLVHHIFPKARIYVWKVPLQVGPFPVTLLTRC